MKLYAPGYYSDFKCIADKCKRSCCIGWEIDIDPVTLDKYRSDPSLHGVLSTVDTSDVPHFLLCEGGRCPHLDPCGLCNIIKEKGEEYISEICREHPRFYNITGRGREVGLGLVCEEAARIVLSSDDYLDFSIVAEDNGVAEEGLADNSDIIGEAYAILSQRSIPYSERLGMLYSLTGVSPDIKADDEWAECLSSCELTDTAFKDYFSDYSSSVDCAAEWSIILERFLAYLIYRHVTPSEGDMDVRASFGFAFLLERLLASVIDKRACKSCDEVIETASLISLELEYSEDNTEELKMEFII